MTPQTTLPTNDAGATAREPAGLAGLRKMSTTAGVGLGDYRAVNALGVAGLVLGVASWLCWLHPLFYLVPALAIVLSLTAMWQVLHSNGTQGGAGLAGVGVVLALGLGGWALTSDLIERRQTRIYRTEIAQMVSDFGRAVSQSDYDAAYALMHENFQSEVDVETFRNYMTGEQSNLGGIRGITSNLLTQIDVPPAGGRPVAEAMLIVEIGRPEPVRQPALLERSPDGWRFVEFGYWFPRDSGSRRG